MIRPVNARVALIDPPSNDRERLVLPVGVNVDPPCGIVRAVSEDLEDQVGLGDLVFYERDCHFNEITVGNEAFKIVRWECVIAVEQ